MSILKFRDENGDIVEVLALQGEKGDQGIQGETGKDNLPVITAVEGDTVSLTMDYNVEYHCSTAVVSLTITGFTASTEGQSSLWSIQFTAGDTITVVLPETVKWSVADPVFTAGVTYWLSFMPLVSGEILGVWVSNE